MNTFFKKFAKKTYHKAQGNSLGKRSITLAFLFRKLTRRFGSREKASSYLAKNMYKLYITTNKFNKGTQIKNLFRKLEITVPKDGFIFFLDEFKNLSEEGHIIDNISIDYSRVLNNSIYDYNEMYFNPKEGYRMKLYSDSDFIRNQQDTVDAIELLIYRIIKKLKKSNHQEKTKFVHYFENMIDREAEHFEEALQRILFYNQLLWQTGHGLNGLGRLDKILEDLYLDDLNSGFITQEEAYELIKSFLKTLHSYYWFKSAALMGDTGQVIILGGKYSDEYGEYYFYNDLTYMFINAIKELQLPDPKVLLRISNQTPRDLIELSLKTINTGIGSPLFSNDEIVIDKMIEFGYDKEDATNYVVSACWEPSALGKGLEQNNINFISFLKPLNEFFDSENKEVLGMLENFDELFNSYKYYLKKEAESLIQTLDDIGWNEDPILSLFIDDCNDKQIDISKGGAKYNHYGITTVSLANTVNSLYNIKKLVFEEKKYTLNELNKMRKNNFKKAKYHNVFNELKSIKPCFAMDDEEILSISNEIIFFLEDCFKGYTNKFGGKIKFGLSAPSYISAGSEISASFDGRKEGEPFSTHISLDTNKDFTEILHFASKLDYGGAKFNGNVVDLMLSPDLIENHLDKFTDFIISSIKLGFFQMQMNVVSSKTLIEAKENPDMHPNLIVRVWGFSAYFNDLPEDYKDLLIKRALKNEGKS
ncbi:formate C-acetyltransferase [Methanobrevibacter olleyae]|uniref:Formate C-acetyltransferase n=1 Tax=Methanobrevibacter olleyae TaxID=294671 RepID=A0A1I4KHE4_METOL|nr:pyruvate formate lyase family protein [Methanobrevibacter olleyae]SFL78190.1 formate C-acetyltransferase [Methanobrevibacter olleyae]